MKNWNEILSYPLRLISVLPLISAAIEDLKQDLLLSVKRRDRLMDKIMQAHAETDIETVYIEQGYGPSISAHTFF